MNHSFIASATNNEICGVCKKDNISHGDEATCECCSNIGPVDLMYGNMLMCISCQDKDKKYTTEVVNNPSAQQQRIDTMNATLAVARKIDESVKITPDLFNAATVSIVELQAAIEHDDSIVNKPYTLAEELTKRLTHFKEVAFKASQELMDANNQQKAIQVYLNNLANKLRAEEREKLKIADINYQPSTKGIKGLATKTVKVSSAKKLDKVELRKYAAELGVAEFTLQMLVVSKGITVEQAANLLRRSLAEAKSESK